MSCLIAKAIKTFKNILPQKKLEDKEKEKLVISESFITFDDGVAAVVVVVVHNLSHSQTYFSYSCAITFI